MIYHSLRPSRCTWTAMKKRVTSRPARPQIFISVDPTGPAPVCPSTLSRTRDNRRRPNASLHTRFEVRPSRITSRRTSVISRGEKGIHNQPGSCASRGSPTTTAAPDGSRCSRLHASFTLPFLRPIRAPPLAHLAGIGPGDETRSARRKTRFPPLRKTHSYVETLCARARVRFEFVICHSSRWMDSRDSCVVDHVYINFFTWKEYLYVDLPRWWWW